MVHHASPVLAAPATATMRTDVDGTGRRRTARTTTVTERGDRGPTGSACSGLRARGRHGWFDWEREQGQEFVVDVELVLDTRAGRARATTSPTPSTTAPSARDVVAIVEGEPVRPGRDAGPADRGRVPAPTRASTSVTVTVHKPQAPMPVASTTSRSPSTAAACGERRRVTAAYARRAGARREPGRPRGHAARGGRRDRGRTRLSSWSAVSPVYETDPVGGPAGPAGVPQRGPGRRHALSATELLDVAQEVERRTAACAPSAGGRARWTSTCSPSATARSHDPGPDPAAPTRPRAGVRAGPVGGRRPGLRRPRAGAGGELLAALPAAELAGRAPLADVRAARPGPVTGREADDLAAAAGGRRHRLRS